MCGRAYVKLINFIYDVVQQKLISACALALKPKKYVTAVRLLQ